MLSLGVVVVQHIKVSAGLFMNEDNVATTL